MSLIFLETAVTLLLKFTDCLLRKISLRSYFIIDKVNVYMNLVLNFTNFILMKFSINVWYLRNLLKLLCFSISMSFVSVVYFNIVYKN